MDLEDIGIPYKSSWYNLELTLRLTCSQLYKGSALRDMLKGKMTDSTWAPGRLKTLLKGFYKVEFRFEKLNEK